MLRQRRILPAALLFCASAATGSSCASLDQLKGIVQPPRFAQSDERPAQLRLLGPSSDMPVGGVGVRLWAKVANPNPFGFTLGTLKGTLFLEGARGASADFPLGLPLQAGEETEVPLDLMVSFSDLPALARIFRDRAQARAVEYRLDGTVGVDAGRLGQPVFGPMTLMNGELEIRSPIANQPGSREQAPMRSDDLADAWSQNESAGQPRTGRPRGAVTLQMRGPKTNQPGSREQAAREDD